MELFTYYRSTASYRVRIALAMKGLNFQSIPVNLIREGGEHNQPAYRQLNPQGRVPALRVDDGQILIQSSAIIEYLEETHPTPPLLFGSNATRARQRAIAGLIGSDIHPLHNASVLKYLREELQQNEAAVTNWIAHWISNGFAAVEQLIGEHGFWFDQPSLADIYLLPQLYAARRFDVALEDYPKILRVEALALEHPAFRQAHPSVQVDTPPPNP